MTEHSAPGEPRFLVDPYLDWVKKEGLTVHEDYGLYLFSLETKMWPRVGSRKCVSRLKQVVLPAPFGPISA